jgi:uncharacterized repeat protein (TIGR01451 family)
LPRRRHKSPASGQRSFRQLLVEALETRSLLSADAMSTLLYLGIANPSASPSNSGLLLATEIASGAVAPLHAPFSSTSDRLQGWTLASDAGFSGLAFGPGGNHLLGATDRGTNSASDLLSMNPYTGTQQAAPVPIRAGTQAIHISDLAAIPGASFQLYGIGSLAAAANAPLTLFVIDPASGQAIAVPDQPSWLASLKTADGLAFGPDGTIYVSGLDASDNAPVLVVQQTANGAPLVTRHTLAERVVGMDTRVAVDSSQTVQVELLASTASGGLRWLDWTTGQFSGQVLLEGPPRGVAGDVVFHPDPGSLTLQTVHHADFENGSAGYTADNSGGTMPGMWHYSFGRWNDRLINHTFGQLQRPGYNWYYGRFETSLGGGTYLTNTQHQGVLTSPDIAVPLCATTTLSFSYLLDVRDPLNVDFVEVWVQYVDGAGQTQRTRLLSRAEGSLPETGNRWLTATADLSAFAGRDVQIQFSFNTGNIPDVDPEGWYVDDVVVASMPKAVCGYKWHDQDYDGQWDHDEPGLNGWIVYADVDGNGRYDPAVSEQTFAGGLDANTFPNGRRVTQPDGQAVLEVSATGEPIWAMPDPLQPSRKVLAWGTGAGEEVWPIGPMLRATFPTPVHTVALDVARADAAGQTRVVLQAYDQHGNRIAEQVRTLADAQWQTLTISVTGGEIAYVKASVDQGSARFNDLRYWGTAPAVEGDPAFVTRNNGQHDGAFSFDRLPPGEYTIREVVPEGWKQSYPGATDFAHTVTVGVGQPVTGHWETTQSPNFGNFQPDVSGYKWHDVDRDRVWDNDEHEGLDGWTIEIYRDSDGDGELGPQDLLIASTQTAFDGQRHGAFWFTGLAPGHYFVREVPQPGWVQSYPTVPTTVHPVEIASGQPWIGRWQVSEAPNFGNFQPPDLMIEKTGTPNPVVAGTELTYLLTATNLGPGDARNVVVTDTLPAGVTPLSNTTCVWDLIPDGQSRSCEIVVMVDPGTLGTLINTASVTSDDEDPEPGNNVVVIETEVVAVADLSITKTGTPDPVAAGEQLTYTLTVSNAGPSHARNVVVTDTLPAGVTPTGDVTCQWDLIPVGQSRSCEIVVTVDPGTLGTILNTAIVTSDADDPEPDDNKVEIETEVIDVADLSITKTGTPDPVAAGEQLTYTLTVSNAGPSHARNVVVTDTLPAGVTPTGDVTCQWDLIPAHESRSCEIVVTVDPGTLGTILNTAIVTSDADDPEPDDNEVEIETEVIDVADLSITKTGTPDPVAAGEQLTYTLTVSNAGPSHARNVVVTDTLPAGVTPTGDVTCQWDLIPAHESRSCEIVVTVDPGTLGTILNTAIVTSDADDPEPDDNEVEIETEVIDVADLSIAKTGHPDPVVAGTQLTYTLTVSNAGPSHARNVIVTDTLPAGVTPTGDVTCQWDLIPLDQSRTCEIVVTVDPGTLGVITNTAIVTSDAEDPDPSNNRVDIDTTVIGAATSVIQFIAPMSVYRPSGPFEPQSPNPSEPVSIQGYLWHDANQNGVWDAGELGRAGWAVFLDLNGNRVWDAFDPDDPSKAPEPLAVTGSDGRYVFTGLEPGSYTVRVDPTGLSDGTFRILNFPGPDPSNSRDPDAHVVDVVAGQPVTGTAGVAEVPNFGSFDYSPFIRPADDFYGHYALASSALKKPLLDAWQPWQSFTVTNTTGSAFQITAIDKHIDTSKIAVAGQFVTVFRKQADGTLIPVAPLDLQRQESEIAVDPPIPVPSGQSIQFFAFYDPAIRDGDQVLEQYPDWFGANQQSHPAHAFARGDHLRVNTDSGAAFRADLVGGSTYDSDIFYDGAVDSLDFAHLDQLLTLGTIEGKLYIPFGDPLFDPTADINARCPNNAEGVYGSCVWPLQGSPQRELGLGDFGPLNVEWNRARAPFLDLDPDNSSGAKGADYAAEFQGTPVAIADADAGFANRQVRALERLVFRIINPSEGDRLVVDDLQIPGTISVSGNGTVQLELTGNATVEQYGDALRFVRFDSSSLAPRTVEIEVRAKGSRATGPGNSFTKLTSGPDDWEIEGNTAIAAIVVKPPSDAVTASVAGTAEGFAAEPESSVAEQLSYDAAVETAAASGPMSVAAHDDGAVSSGVWQNPANPLDVNGDQAVTPWDVLLIVNRLEDGSLPLHLAGSPPFHDVNGDGNCTALDALLVINFLESKQIIAGEGEAVETLEEPSLNRVSLNRAEVLPAPQNIVAPENNGWFVLDAEPRSIVANGNLDPADPADASSVMPPAVFDEPNHPAISEQRDAEDEIADWDSATPEIEGLLNDLVEDLAAAWF